MFERREGYLVSYQRIHGPKQYFPKLRMLLGPCDRLNINRGFGAACLSVVAAR